MTVQHVIDQFLIHHTENSVKNTLVLTVCESYIESSFDKFLVDYIESQLCAMISQKHFVVIVHRDNSNLESGLFEIFPQEVLHRNATNSVPDFNQLCPCRSHCQNKPWALIFKNPLQTRLIIQQLNYKRIVDVRKTVALSTAWKFIWNSSSPVSGIPFVPDVSIDYHCSDDLAAEEKLMPFTSYTVNRVHLKTKAIYVFFDSGDNRAMPSSSTSGVCASILIGLMNHLSGVFPNALVAVFRDTSIVDHQVILMNSQVTFCSEQLSCLFPAMGSLGRRVYVPHSPVMAHINHAVLHDVYHLSLSPHDRMCDKKVVFSRSSNESLMLQCLTKSCNC